MEKCRKPFPEAVNLTYHPHIVGNSRRPVARRYTGYIKAGYREMRMQKLAAELFESLEKLEIGRIAVDYVERMLQKQPAAAHHALMAESKTDRKSVV